MALHSCEFVVMLLLVSPFQVAGKGAMFPSMKRRLHHSQAAAQEAPQQPASDSSTETKIEDADQNPADVSIPAPVGIGADGFPVLPAVSKILGGASKTLEQVNSEAAVLEQRMAKIQKQSAENMAHQKSVYEQKLKLQEAGNKAVIAHNGQIAKNIEKLKKANDALRKHGHELQGENKLMRTELKTLQTKIGEGLSFVTDSMTKTDDSKSPALAVLQTPSAHKRHHHAATDDDKDDDEDDKSSDDDDEQSGDEDDDNSFVEVSSRRSARRVFEDMALEVLAQPVPTPEVDPRNLLNVLSVGIDNVKKQEEASEEQLKSLFLRSFKAGAVRNAALLQQQKAFNATRLSLENTQQKLLNAEKHLQGTHDNLSKRLHVVGHFLQKLTHLAQAPASEVSKTLDSIPKAPHV